MHGWKVTAFEANVVGWKTRLGGLSHNDDHREMPGVQFVVTVSRITKEFWVVITVKFGIVLPQIIDRISWLCALCQTSEVPRAPPFHPFFTSPYHHVEVVSLVWT